MKKVILTALAVLSLTACGKETIREVLVTTPPTEAPAAPEVNKYDAYLNSLYDNSAQARTWTEDQLLKFGTLVCDAFGSGNTLARVIDVLQPYSNGSYDDELFAAIIAGSVTHLCPEYTSMIQAQL
jgi:hypothetical protein